MIETDRLVLRPPAAGDVPVLAALLAAPEVMQYIGTGETVTAEDAAAHFDRMQQAWREDGFGPLVALRRDDGRIVGRIGLLAWDPLVWRPGLRAEIGSQAEVEIGWMLLHEHWGFGYATEAALATRDWAIREIGPPRLISLIHPENARSLAVAQRIGEQFDSVITTHRGIETELWSLDCSVRHRS